MSDDKTTRGENIERLGLLAFIALLIAAMGLVMIEDLNIGLDRQEQACLVPYRRTR